MSARNLLFIGSALVVALLLAGGVSYWASGSPDGLNKVAIELGFDDSETGHTSADSPLAGYGAQGVDEPWLSGATAGAAGVAVCFALAAGIGLAARRRSGAHDDSPTDGRP